VGAGHALPDVSAAGEGPVHRATRCLGTLPAPDPLPRPPGTAAGCPAIRENSPAWPPGSYRGRRRSSRAVVGVCSWKGRCPADVRRPVAARRLQAGLPGSLACWRAVTSLRPDRRIGGRRTPGVRATSQGRGGEPLRRHVRRTTQDTTRGKGNGRPSPGKPALPMEVQVTRSRSRYRRSAVHSSTPKRSLPTSSVRRRTGDHCSVRTWL